MNSFKLNANIYSLKKKKKNFFLNLDLKLNIKIKKNA